MRAFKIKKNPLQYSNQEGVLATFIHSKINERAASIFCYRNPLFEFWQQKNTQDACDKCVVRKRFKIFQNHFT